ncbi:MAG: dihydroneopterin aldolase [bacterium]|jgi:dihydroneopterin aldolase|nr:dihydroneopterin aldolase [bacterium]
MHHKVFPRIRRNSDRVGIEGIQFYAYHGHRAEESTLGQRFQLSVQAFLDCSTAGRSDALEDALNYHSLHASVTQWVTTRRFHLLECLVEGLADEIFRQFPQVDALQLCIRKPHPPIPNFFGHVEVEINRVHPRWLAGPGGDGAHGSE